MLWQVYNCHTATRHAAILGEFSELMLSLARKVHADAMAAETPEETAVLAKAVHQLGRGLRQTLALEARLEREAKREADARERTAADAAKAAHTAQLDIKRAQVRAGVARLIWAEAERAEAEDEEIDTDELEDTLDYQLGGLVWTARLETEPVETLVAALAAELEVSPPPEPDPPPPPGPAPPQATPEPGRISSA